MTNPNSPRPSGRLLGRSEPEPQPEAPAPGFVQHVGSAESKPPWTLMRVLIVVVLGLIILTAGWLIWGMWMYLQLQAKPPPQNPTESVFQNNYRLEGEEHTGRVCCVIEFKGKQYAITAIDVFGSKGGHGADLSSMEVGQEVEGFSIYDVTDEVGIPCGKSLVIGLTQTEPTRLAAFEFEGDADVKALTLAEEYPLPTTLLWGFGFEKSTLETARTSVEWAHKEQGVIVLAERFPKSEWLGCPFLNSEGEVVGLFVGGRIRNEEEESILLSGPQIRSLLEKATQ